MRGWSLPVRACSSMPSTPSAIASFVTDLVRRELISGSYPSPLDQHDHQQKLQRLPCAVYAGFDPTAPSLHVGNLLVLLSLFRSSRFGCEPIALVGGATALVGDPAGRTTDRDSSRLHEANENKEKVRKQILQLWENARERHLQNTQYGLHVIDNSEWYSKMNLVEFLSSTRALRMGEMLRTRAIRSRLEAGAGDGVSFPEFAYQSLQAFDWRTLAERHECLFQLGGSDQLGHLDIGAHFIERTLGKWAAGVCLPLLTDSSGSKLGKSTGAGGAWLDATMTSPFHFYQLLRQLHDDAAALMLTRCSLRETEEVYALDEEHKASLGSCVAQIAIANELTGIVHGETALEQARTASRALFYGSMADVEALPAAMLEEVFGRPIELAPGEVVTMGELADRTRQDKQKGSQLMMTGAFKINGVKRVAPEEKVDVASIALSNASNMTLVCWGKRKFQLVRWI